MIKKTRILILYFLILLPIIYYSDNVKSVTLVSTTDNLYDINRNENNTIISFYLNKKIQIDFDNAMISGFYTIPNWNKTLMTAEGINVSKYSFAQYIISTYRSLDHPGISALYWLNEVYLDYYIADTSFTNAENLMESKYRIGFFGNIEDSLKILYIYNGRLLSNGLAITMNENSTHVVGNSAIGFNTHDKYLMLDTEIVIQISAKFVYNGDSNTLPVNSTLIPLGVVGDENPDITNVTEDTIPSIVNFFTALFTIFLIPLFVYYYTKNPRYFQVTIPVGAIVYCVIYDVSFVYYIFIVLGAIIFYLKNRGVSNE